MQIKQMFVKPIDRDLKGVIKVGQDDDANIKQELEEYVVTKELQKHFRDFFDAYKQGINGNTDKMGVWISGFFGSGKSHFLKILSYLLANSEVDGRKAIDYFVDDKKITDATVIADMKLAASIETDAALFNIDSKSEMNGKENKEAILSVFLKVFNEMLGFSGAIPVLADMERNLSEAGRYDEFMQKFRDATGDDWKEKRSEFDFVQDDVVDVLVDMGYMSESAARNLCEKATQPYTISIDDFAKMVKKHIDSKGNNYHLVFLVDEIGQYIGDNSQLMLNLQTVVENLGTACGGKAWVIVTSQQDIDSITKTKGNDFSKIQGRFDTRLSLSSANVDEVIRKRILEKTESATETLSLYYDEKETIIKNLIVFNDGIEKKLYDTRENFSAVYPFIPYQFNLLGSVLTAIRTHGASGKHLAEGERSMLALFKESAAAIKEEETGRIVPFHMFYDALEQFLDHSHKGVISRALEYDSLNPEHAEESFDVNVLKTLFMIKYVKEIKANAENLTSLMVSDIEDDRMSLLKRVEETLKRLEKQTFVQRNGDIYVFLTNEEQEINRAIESQPVDPGEIMAKVSELIFEDLFDEKKYRYPAMNGRYTFAFNQIVDERPFKANQNHDITLKILTPNSDEVADEQTMRMVSAQQSKSVIVVLPDDRVFLEEIRTAKQIEKFIQFDAVNTVTKYEEIKAAKKVEAHDRNKAAKLFLEESLKAATIYVNGDKIQSNAKEVETRINEAIGKLVATVFHKLSYIDTAMGENEIRSLFAGSGGQIKLEGTDSKPNALALTDVSNYIKTNTERHTKTSMKSLLDRFMKAPYGFVEADVQWLVAKLFRDGEIAFYVNSELVSMQSKTTEELVRYVTRKEFVERLMTEKLERVSETAKKDVKRVMKELWNVSPSTDDDFAVMSSFMNYAERMKNELEKLEIEYKNQMTTCYRYPGKQVIMTGKQLMVDAMQLTHPYEFYSEISKRRDDYLDFAEEYDRVKKFFGGEQKEIFDRATRLMTIYDDSKTFIVSDEIEKTVGDVKDIMKKAAPYSDIFKLPGLLDQFLKVYDELLRGLLKPVTDAISEASTRVHEELKGKQCETALKGRFIERFREIHDKATSCNNVATLQNIKLEADALKVRCLNEIADEERKLQEKALPPTPPVTSTEGDGAGITTQQQPQTIVAEKKKKTISIKSICTEATWQIETKEDVKKYVDDLEKKLIAQIEDDTIVNVEL